MNDYANAIEIKNVTKKYDGFTLDSISFDVPRGSIMGFIGQNGAGKTTTIRSLLNIIPINAGKINLLGMDHIEHEQAIKERLAVVFDELPFHDLFNAKEMGLIFKGLYEKWDDKVYAGYLERFELPQRKKIGQFSKGMKMKLQIACALSHDAELLVMDEATTGLDPVVTFIDRGKILVTGYKDDVLEQHGILKCTKAEFKDVDPEDYVSARLTDFGAEAMVSDRAAMARKYEGLMLEPTTLEDIMVYYVHRTMKEWTS